MTSADCHRLPSVITVTRVQAEEHDVPDDSRDRYSVTSWPLEYVQYPSLLAGGLVFWDP